LAFGSWRFVVGLVAMAVRESGDVPYVIESPPASQAGLDPGRQESRCVAALNAKFATGYASARDPNA
jgi:hypothetical protein